MHYIVCEIGIVNLLDSYTIVNSLTELAVDFDTYYD